MGIEESHTGRQTTIGSVLTSSPKYRGSSAGERTKAEQSSELRSAKGWQLLIRFVLHCFGEPNNIKLLC